MCTIISVVTKKGRILADYTGYLVPLKVSMAYQTLLVYGIAPLFKTLPAVCIFTEHGQEA